MGSRAGDRRGDRPAEPRPHRYRAAESRTHIGARRGAGREARDRWRLTAVRPRRGGAAQQASDHRTTAQHLTQPASAGPANVPRVILAKRPSRYALGVVAVLVLAL